MALSVTIAIGGRCRAGRFGSRTAPPRKAPGPLKRLPMDEVKKKVLLDLFVSPWTLVPMVGGLSAWMISFGVGGDPTLNLIGLAGVLVGAGIQASRLIWGVEELTERAHGYLSEQERARLDSYLDDLGVRLAQDDDWRTEESLKRLRALYAALDQDDPPRGHAAITIREKVEKLFQASVKQLERSHQLWEKARRLPKGTRGPLLEQRGKAIDEVVLTVNHLQKTVAQYHSFHNEESDDELAKLREELDATIEVARRADQRMENLETSPAYDESEFE